MKSGARREEIATVARPGDMTAPLLRTSHVHSKLRILGPMLLAALCLAAPIGTFDDESAIAESQTPGHTVFNSSFGEYTVTGTRDIGETSDGFHYVWKKVSGDVTIGAAGDRKAALMIRQTLDPRAPYAAAVLRGDGQAVFQYRPDTGRHREALTWARRPTWPARCTCRWRGGVTRLRCQPEKGSRGAGLFRSTPPRP